MKKFILLFVLFFNCLELKTNGINEINEDENSLILLITDENDCYYYTSIELTQLKKCTFPIGALRNNDIEFCDFKKIHDYQHERIIDSIDCGEYKELALFRIDSEVNGVNTKTCGFAVPGKGDLCYAFKFEFPIKETKAAILNNEQLDELEATIYNSAQKKLLSSNVQPQSKLKKYLQDIAITVFINSLEIFEKFKLSYDKVINYLKRSRNNEQSKA